MQVREIMTTAVKVCRVDATLGDAVEIMWDADCGIVPVTDQEDRTVGVITDRDICIACWSRGARPDELTVEGTMSRDVKTCAPDDTIADAEQTMQEHRIRRLPVVDARGRLVGIVSMNDISRAADPQVRGAKKRPDVRAEDVVHTLAAICRPRFASTPALVRRSA